MTFTDSDCQLISVCPSSSVIPGPLGMPSLGLMTKNVVIYHQTGEYEEHLVLDASLVDIEGLREDLEEEDYEYLHSLILADERFSNGRYEDDCDERADGDAVIRDLSEPAYYRENIVDVIYHHVHAEY